MKIRCSLIAILLVTGITACKKTPPPVRAEPPPPPAIDPAQCEFDDVAAQVWNESVQDSLDLSVKIMDDIIEAWEAENLTLWLDEFTRDWTAARESACRAHYFEKQTSDERYREQTTCFDEMLDKARQVIGRMRNGDRAALDACRSLESELDACI
jgi:hypothetical protein